MEKLNVNTNDFINMQGFGNSKVFNAKECQGSKILKYVIRSYFSYIVL